MVAIAEGGPQWTSHSIIVVCNLTTNQSAVVKNIAQFIRLLAPSHSQLYIMALSYALLCLYLSSYKLVVYVFHVSNAGERHLLFNIMTEPVASNGIAENYRNDWSEEQASIEHRLDGQVVVYRE